MGKLPNGILGRLSASVGSVTGASCKGKPVLRTKSSGGINPRTEKQQLARRKFTDASIYVRENWNEIMALGLFHEVKGKTLWMQAMSWRLNGGSLPWPDPQWSRKQESGVTVYEVHYARRYNMNGELSVGIDVEDFWGEGALLLSYQNQSNNITYGDNLPVAVGLRTNNTSIGIVVSATTAVSNAYVSNFEGGVFECQIRARGGSIGSDVQVFNVRVFMAEYEEDVVYSRSATQEDLYELLKDRLEFVEYEGQLIPVSESNLLQNYYYETFGFGKDDFLDMPFRYGSGSYVGYLKEDWAMSPPSIEMSAMTEGRLQYPAAKITPGSWEYLNLAGVHYLVGRFVCCIGPYYFPEGVLLAFTNSHYTGVFKPDSGEWDYVQLWIPSFSWSEIVNRSGNFYARIPFEGLSVENNRLYFVFSSAEHPDNKVVMYEDGRWYAVSGGATYSGFSVYQYAFSIPGWRCYTTALAEPVFASLQLNGGEVYGRLTFKLWNDDNTIRCRVIFNALPV